MKDLSLNDCLEKGLNTIPYIFNILLKFRSYPIGIVSDVEKVFHQIVVALKDHNMLKFLWFDNISNCDPQIIQYRLVFGLTPSPAILSETIHHHVTRYLLTEPGIAEILASGFYVDDFTTGTQTVEEGFDIYKKARLILNKEVLIFVNGKQIPRFYRIKSIWQKAKTLRIMK